MKTFVLSLCLFALVLLLPLSASAAPPCECQSSVCKCGIACECHDQYVQIAQLFGGRRSIITQNSCANGQCAGGVCTPTKAVTIAGEVKNANSPTTAPAPVSACASASCQSQGRSFRPVRNFLARLRR